MPEKTKQNKDDMDYVRSHSVVDRELQTQRVSVTEAQALEFPSSPLLSSVVIDEAPFV